MHPKDNLETEAGVPLDLDQLTDDQVVAAFANSLRGINYVNVYLGPVAATVCVSRARLCYNDTNGEDRWVPYIGISVVETMEEERGKGHFLQLIERLYRVARHVNRALAITEIRSQRLRDILEKHPDIWIRVRAPDDIVCPNFVRL